MCLSEFSVNMCVPREFSVHEKDLDKVEYAKRVDDRSPHLLERR